jgi:molybdopterin molybdotransferase
MTDTDANRVEPTPAQALGRIVGRVRPLPVESRPLATLHGAALAQDVVAERDQPPFDRVTMDGIAIASAAWSKGRRRFEVAGIQAAGAAPLTLSSADHCLEVMTGAVLPLGCDAVVPYERLELADGVAELRDSTPIEPFVNVHTRGLDCRAGERLLEAGTRIGGPELMVIASAGLPRAQVRAEPRIVVVTTGDELVEPGEPIEAWQIRRSNAHALRGALTSRGYCQVADDHLADDPDELRDRLAAHLATHDVLILTGGVSMGRFDHVPAILRELGVSEVLHRIAQRPGRPLWFGVGGSGQLVFGLPGNPVSSLVCLVRYVVPALAEAIGARPAEPEAVALGEPFRVKPALFFFLPVALRTDATLGRVALPRTTHGSGDFVSLLGTDGFVELPPGPAEYPAGRTFPLYRW